MADLKRLALEELARRELAKRQSVPRGTVQNPSSLVPGEGFQSTEQPEQSNPLFSSGTGSDPSLFESMTGERPRAALPAVGGIAGAASGALPVAVIGSGIGAGLGKLGEQKLESGKVDLYDATKEGGLTAAGTLAGGLAFKALGGLANKIFSPQPLSKEMSMAADLAKQEGIPFPFPGGRVGQLFNAASLSTLPARVATQNQAKKAAQFINKSLLDDIPDVARNAKPVEEITAKGKEFFKNIYDPVADAADEGFKKFVNTVGSKTSVSTKNLSLYIDDAILDLKKAGAINNSKSGGLWGLLQNEKKLGFHEKTLDQYEIIRKAISKSARESKGATKQIADELKERIFRDYDNIGANVGVDVRGLAEEAIQKSAIFHKLERDYPELKFFSKDINPETWLKLLFQEKNAGALAQIRKKAPDMYKELSDTWLASEIQNRLKVAPGTIGKIIDGTRFNAWVTKEKSALSKILGNEKYNVIRNFSEYTKNLETIVNRPPMDPLEVISRVGGEIGGALYKPHIFIPGEVGAYVLAKGLSNPNSKLFKLFSSGVGPTFKKSTGLAFKGVGQVTIPEDSLDAR